MPRWLSRSVTSRNCTKYNEISAALLFDSCVKSWGPNTERHQPTCCLFRIWEFEVQLNKVSNAISWMRKVCWTQSRWDLSGFPSFFCPNFGKSSPDQPQPTVHFLFLPHAAQWNIQLIFRSSWNHKQLSTDLLICNPKSILLTVKSETETWSTWFENCERKWKMCTIAVLVPAL